MLFLGGPSRFVFKPFVYAAGHNPTALYCYKLCGGITPASTVPDAPSSCQLSPMEINLRGPLEITNKDTYTADVTLRYALAMSLNINHATVKLAEEVGYDKVAEPCEILRESLSVKPLRPMALVPTDSLSARQWRSLRFVRKTTSWPVLSPSC